MQLKKISEQTVVITGATSGIGLTTARRAAKAGAKLVLVARNENALRELTNEITAGGGRAIYVVADVADEAALRGVAAAAAEEFAGFDTWVNNAGASIYGKIEDNTHEDMQRLFDTNFWGVVYGSRVAAEFLRTYSKTGGAIINVGSVLSDRAIAYQGLYSASKHAVKGFTDALRMELEIDKAPISVTLLKPSAIATPYAEHAKNYFDKEATLPPPVFSPDLVAEAIIHCAQTPERDFTVGEGKFLASVGEFAPRLTDKLMEWDMAHRQFKNEPKKARVDGLQQTASDLRERGNTGKFVFEESLYQRAKLNPLVTSALVIGGAAAIAALLARRQSSKKRGFDLERYYESDQYNFAGQTDEAPRNRRRFLRENERDIMQVGHS